MATAVSDAFHQRQGPDQDAEASERDDEPVRATAEANQHFQKGRAVFMTRQWAVRTTND